MDTGVAWGVVLEMARVMAVLLYVIIGEEKLGCFFVLFWLAH